MSANARRTASKSLLDEATQTQLAIRMIGYGARIQVLEAETKLSRDRLIRLYKECHGKSPSKGMLPFSAEHARLVVSFVLSLSRGRRAGGARERHSGRISRLPGACVEHRRGCTEFYAGVDVDPLRGEFGIGPLPMRAVWRAIHCSRV